MFFLIWYGLSEGEINRSALWTSLFFRNLTNQVPILLGEMTMKKLFLTIIYLTTFFINIVIAAPTLSIDPSTLKVHAPKNIFVDINISGLQSGDTNTQLGGWELDFSYDPNIFTFLAVPPAGLGGSLGDIDLGEAINLSQPVTTPGIFHVGVLSLLEGDAATCFFCVAPFLEDLQSDSFTLATVGLFLPGGSSFTGSTPLKLENAILSDANGNEITNTTILQGVVKISEPGIMFLIVFGLAGIGFTGKKNNIRIIKYSKLFVVLVSLICLNQKVHATATYEGSVTIGITIAGIENITSPGDLTGLKIQAFEEPSGRFISEEIDGRAIIESNYSVDVNALNQENISVGEGFIIQHTVMATIDPIGSATFRNWAATAITFDNKSASDTFRITLKGNVIAKANGNIDLPQTETLNAGTAVQTDFLGQGDVSIFGEGAFSDSRKGEITFLYTIAPQISGDVLRIQSFIDGSATSTGISCNGTDGVQNLITAINNANANPDTTIINLEGTCLLSQIDNELDGSNGLPSIQTPIKIIGSNKVKTFIQRNETSENFRIFHVSGNGELTLENLTIKGGREDFGGAGILNIGTTNIRNTTIIGNITSGSGGGIQNFGILSLIKSTISNNTAFGSGAGIFNKEGTLTILNTTITRNQSDDGAGGGIMTTGKTTIVNSTIAFNIGAEEGGGIAGNSETKIKNSIIAFNSAPFVPGFGVDNCSGTVTSIGYNLVGKSFIDPDYDDNINLCDFDPSVGDLNRC